MALGGREARANWTPRIFTGHKGRPSLRGGSCTAPVATKAPHHRPSSSPLTLSLSLSFFPLRTPTPRRAPGGIDTAATKPSPILSTVKPRRDTISPTFPNLYLPPSSSSLLVESLSDCSTEERREKVFDLSRDDR